MIACIVLDYPALEKYSGDILIIEKKAKTVFGNLYDTGSWGRDEFIAKRKNKNVLSCGLLNEKDCRLIGFSIAYEAADTVAHISRIAIDSDELSKGYGSRLIDFELELIRKAGYKLCSIDLGILNKKARLLYEKKGFRLLDGEKLNEYVQSRRRDKSEYLGDTPSHIAMMAEL